MTGTSRLDTVGALADNPRSSAILRCLSTPRPVSDFLDGLTEAATPGTLDEPSPAKAKRAEHFHPGTIESHDLLALESMETLLSTRSETDKVKLDTVKNVQKLFGGFVLPQTHYHSMPAGAQTQPRSGIQQTANASASDPNWSTFVCLQIGHGANSYSALYEDGWLKRASYSDKTVVELNYIKRCLVSPTLTFLRITDAQHNVVAFFYDQNGALEAVIDSKSHWTRAEAGWRDRNTSQIARQVIPGMKGSYTVSYDGSIETFNHKVKTRRLLNGEELTTKFGYWRGVLKTQRIYDTDKKLLLEISYRRDGRTVYWATVYGRNGKLLSRISFDVTGVPEYRLDYMQGLLVAQTWFKNGKRERQLKYLTDGKTTGSLIKFDENGRPEFETVYLPNGLKGKRANPCRRREEHSRRSNIWRTRQC